MLGGCNFIPFDVVPDAHEYKLWGGLIIIVFIRTLVLIAPIQWCNNNGMVYRLNQMNNNRMVENGNNKKKIVFTTRYRDIYCIISFI